MKFLNILFCTLFLLSTNLAYAGKGSSSSKGMSRGFSSSRTSSTVSPPPAAKSSSFGSFGKSSNANSGSSSVSSRDMSQTQAQQNAMKNWDARQAQKNPNINPPSATSVTGKPLPAYGNTNPYPPAQNSPVYANQQGGSKLGAVAAGALAGVVVGSMMTHSNDAQANERAYRRQQGVDAVNADGEFKQSAITVDGNGVANSQSGATSHTATNVSQEKESSGFVWVFLIGVMALAIWAVRKRQRQLRQEQAGNATRYHLGKG